MSSTPYHENALHITAFLGGTTFAAMILLVELRKDFPFADALITATAIVSFLFIISTVGMIHAAYSKSSNGKVFARFVEQLGSAGLFGLMVILPLIVGVLNFDGGLAVAVVESIVIIAFIILRIKDKMKKP